jgi:hypothetical protein
LPYNPNSPWAYVMLVDGPTVTGTKADGSTVSQSITTNGSVTLSSDFKGVVGLQVSATLVHFRDGLVSSDEPMQIIFWGSLSNFVVKPNCDN